MGRLVGVATASKCHHRGETSAAELLKLTEEAPGKNVAESEVLAFFFLVKRTTLHLSWSSGCHSCSRYEQRLVRNHLATRLLERVW